MRITQAISLPGKITSVDLSPSGDRLAVVVGDRDAHSFRRSSADAAFTPEKIVPLVLQRPANDQEIEEEEGEAIAVRLRAAFLGETTLVVMGEARDISLAAFGVEIETGERTGEFRAESMFPGVEGPPPLPISPRHVLVQTLDNVVCLEAPSLREVFRIRHYDEEGGVLGEDDLEDCDSQVAGIAFDPDSAVLHVLWGVFNSGSLTGYRLDLEKGECRRTYLRRDVCTDVPAGLCLTPGGDGGLTAFTLTMDSVVPLPEGGSGATSEDPPYFAPLGFLCLVEDAAEDRPRRIDVRSALMRDFYWSFHHFTPAGEHSERATGIRLSALEPPGASLFYTAPGRVVIPSPGGFLIAVDTVAGAEVERLDLGAPLAAACWHAPSRTLVAGCDEGRLFVVTA